MFVRSNVVCVVVEEKEKKEVVVVKKKPRIDIRLIGLAITTGLALIGVYMRKTRT